MWEYFYDLCSLRESIFSPVKFLWFQLAMLIVNLSHVELKLKFFCLHRTCKVWMETAREFQQLNIQPLIDFVSRDFQFLILKFTQPTSCRWLYFHWIYSAIDKNSNFLNCHLLCKKNNIKIYSPTWEQQQNRKALKLSWDWMRWWRRWWRRRWRFLQLLRELLYNRK